MGQFNQSAQGGRNMVVLVMVKSIHTGRQTSDCPGLSKFASSPRPRHRRTQIFGNQITYGGGTLQSIDRACTYQPLDGARHRSVLLSELCIRTPTSPTVWSANSVRSPLSQARKRSQSVRHNSRCEAVNHEVMGSEPESESTATDEKGMEEEARRSAHHGETRGKPPAQQAAQPSRPIPTGIQWCRAEPCLLWLPVASIVCASGTKGGK
jgi:hypothetical protein